MIAGLGRHTRDIYFPLLEGSARSPRIGCVVERASRKGEVEAFLRGRRLQPESVIYVDDAEAEALSIDLRRALERHVREHDIGGLIVATPPERHLTYARWGAAAGLHLLVDKPLTTRSGILFDEELGAGLLADSDALARTLGASSPEPVCIVAVHRRFHPAWELMRSLLEEVANRLDCPITSINTEYSDGEWRLPHDVLNQEYHPYSLGYGILSHSGYHLVDAMVNLIQAAQPGGKEVDGVEVSAAVVRPVEQLSHLGFEDYRRLFPAHEFDARHPYSEAEYRVAAARCGEMDAFVTAQFLRGRDRMTTATLQLHHNSLSHRFWLDVGDRNLYQGNGRLRHESYTIRQGPFQIVRLSSLQAAKESRGLDADFDVGGKNHIEITVFRNREIFGAKDSFRRYGSRDLGCDWGMASHLEASKRGMLDEFLRVVEGERDNLRGTLASHRPSIAMLSLIYRAAARRLGGSVDLLRAPFSFSATAAHQGLATVSRLPAPVGAESGHTLEALRALMAGRP
jgi:predicted dehydrogenase